MRYDICKRKAPEMPNLGKGTECIKLLLSQASKDMYEPLVPMLFPSLGEHITVTRRDDGTYHPNFRPIHTGPGFSVAQYATDVANELLWALGGLVGEE